ncbi:MAG: 50S ribosomal protein L9 [Dehalococcoidia bacterium]|nr:50S ribosomal protein L9 [Chloroflexota bacterium]MDP6056890.1 50S ribosomal protein L9 [Dehalococcoidia bacterium]MDP7089822.1 50S ribosomal protein L9 [Dehalococcoidia bacterium]MDP7261122.1 50S ribosomal protein L9 [Dehalococcoidia bacterium]MDP7485681.1 50S ribosomal protein L9 [Dehalococcoidia bacterium]
MKVLFLQDVRPTARAGDVKEVKNGFARNYLLPQGFAVLATEHELRRAAALRQQAEDRRLVEAKEWQEVADTLKEHKVRIDVRTGPTGRLYGSVTNTMIAAKLSEMTEREIDRKGIQIPAPIRVTGDYKIPARFVEGVSATIMVEVVADDASKELNKQMEEAAAMMTEEDTNVLDPSFEDVLAEAEAKIDEEASGESEDSEETAEGDAESSGDAGDEAVEDSEEKSEE